MKQPHVCTNCHENQAVYATRDVTITHKNLTTSVKGISGHYCDECGEIDFDIETDSADRYAAAGDALVIQAREKALAIGNRLKQARLKLNLTQAKASSLSGGGHNAFSRYETGNSQPLAAVVNLFSLLENHPELLSEVESYSEIS